MSKKYGQFNKEGFPIGFYDDEIGEIPQDAISITHEQWEEFINNQGARKWNGTDVIVYDKPFSEKDCIRQIKAKTKLEILAIASIEDQINLSARALELLELKLLDTATAEEIIELELIRSLNLRKKSILVKSAELRAQYTTLGKKLTRDDLIAIETSLKTAGE